MYNNKTAYENFVFYSLSRNTFKNKILSCVVFFPVVLVTLVKLTW